MVKKQARTAVEIADASAPGAGGAGCGKSCNSCNGAGGCAQAVAAKAQVARFVVDRATQAALEVVTSCAVDGNPLWELFFEQGLADAISEDAELEAQFFERLCKTRGLPHSAPIVDAYLTSMPAERRNALMEAASLKRKAHPVNLAFYGASFNTAEGGYFLEVFKVFLKHGLTPEKMDIIANRCFDELERACNLGNERFMRVVIPMLAKLPEELVQRIVSRSARAEEVIAVLTKHCSVPISVFTDPKVLVAARAPVAEYIIAVEARCRREPVREPARMESEL